MFASDPSLHPLGKPVAAGEIQFVLRRAAAAGDAIGVECVYRPYRGRDVKRTWNLNFLRGWIGGGSRELIRVHGEEFHSVRKQFQATDSDITFTVSLRDPEREYRSYQLEAVSVIARVTGTIDFKRWFATAPALDAGFGFICTTESLRGVIRPSGLGSQPLRGSLPLWPTLRSVDLEFAPVDVTRPELFDAGSKHYWDGWRQTSPQSWPGGKTILLRHIDGPTVWRQHEYYAYPPGTETTPVVPHPPAGVLPGVQLEIFWPEGKPLEFPETRFDREVQVVAAPASKLNTRLRDLLAQSMKLRPGLEHGSLSAAEWQEYDPLMDGTQLALKIEMATASGGKTVLKVSRNATLTEPWLMIFGIPYDAGRRVNLTSAWVTPERWAGPLPD